MIKVIKVQLVETIQRVAAARYKLMVVDLCWGQMVARLQGEGGRGRDDTGLGMTTATFNSKYNATFYQESISSCSFRRNVSRLRRGGGWRTGTFVLGLVTWNI